MDQPRAELEAKFAAHPYLKQIKTLKRQHEEAMSMKQKIVFGTVCTSLSSETCVCARARIPSQAHDKLTSC